MDKRSKVARSERLAWFVKAIGTELRSVDSLQLDGQMYTPAALAKAFQEEIDELRNVDHARAVYLAAVARERDVKARNRSLLKAFEGYLHSSYGANDARLAKFHLEPPKKAKRSSREKAQAAEKGVATRTERGSLGKKKPRKKAPKA